MATISSLLDASRLLNENSDPHTHRQRVLPPSAPEDGPAPVFNDTRPRVSTDQATIAPAVQDDVQTSTHPVSCNVQDAGSINMGQALARLLQCLIEDWQVVEEDTVQATGTQGRKKVFALMKQKTSKERAQSAAQFTAPTATHDRYDYQQKYATDAYNEGMSPNARVWRVFLDEAGPFDLDMVENIRDTVDVILVFAGLFSAIVSTLVSQTSTALQQDYGLITSALLTELIEVQRSIASGANPIDVSRSALTLDSPPTSTSPDRWVNGMWFVSLAFSLSTALLAVLVKQWIQAFVSPISGTPQHQGRVRHFRYMGIEKWQVPLIVGLLPTLLHLSLFLFFIGLVVFLSTLNTAIAVVVGCIALIAYAAYTISNLLPVWYPECPYKTPLSAYAFIAVRILSTRLHKHRQQIQGYLAPFVHTVRVTKALSALLLRKSHIVLQQMAAGVSLYALAIKDGCSTVLRRTRTLSVRLLALMLPRTRIAEDPPILDVEEAGEESGLANDVVQSSAAEEHNENIAARTLQKAEAGAVLRDGGKLDAYMLSWLCDMSSNPSVRAVVSSAITDLHLECSDEAMDIFRTGVLRHVCDGLKECTIPSLGLSFGHYRDPRQGAEEKLLLFMGAHLRLHHNIDDTPVEPCNSCQCDWLFAESFQQPHYKGWHVMFHRPIKIAWSWVSIQELQALQPPVVPQFQWIVLLIRGFKDAPYGVDAPGRSISIQLSDNQWSAFSSHWAFNHRNMARDWYSDKTSVPVESFSLLEGVLLSAYLCQWTAHRIGHKVEQHNLFITFVLRMQRPARIPSSEHLEMRQQYQSLRLYYDLQSTIHILTNLAETGSTAANSLLRVVERLLPLHEYLFPFSRLFTTDPNKTSEGAAGAIALYAKDRRFLTHIQKLIPTPIGMAHLLSASSTLDPPSDVLKFVLSMCKFFIQINEDQAFASLKQNSLLQALDEVRHHLLVIPSEHKSGRAAVSLLQDIFIEYLEWTASQPDHIEHLDYIFEHLTLVSACSIINLRWFNDLVSPTILDLLKQKPLDPAWDNAILCLADMQELKQFRSFGTGERRRDLVADFITSLTIKRKKAREGQLELI